MGLIILREKCIACGICVKKCPFGALVMTDGKIDVLPSCTLCGICVDVCPVDALEVPERTSSEEFDPDLYRGVWVFVQADGDDIHHVSLELVEEGGKLAAELETDLCCMVLGKDTSVLTEKFSHYSIDRLYVTENPVLEQYRTKPYVEAAAALIETYKPEIVLIGATSTGRDFAGSLATRLETGLTADCTGLAIEKETRGLLQTRPAFGGNIMATIKSSNHRPQMATVRPKVFPMPLMGDKRNVDIIRHECDLTEEGQPTEILEWIPVEEGVSIADADVIVSGGRGMGKPENLALCRDLAALLDGAVGASRGAVDAGWIGYSHQVGQTGRTVRPGIYIACGISGAVQHLAGMKTSDVIIAVNSDPDATIFGVATYGFVGDALEILPKVIHELKKRLSKS